jgi:hypothetical protein
MTNFSFEKKNNIKDYLKSLRKIYQNKLIQDFVPTRNTTRYCFGCFGCFGLFWLFWAVLAVWAVWAVWAVLTVWAVWAILAVLASVYLTITLLIFN